MILVWIGVGIVGLSLIWLIGFAIGIIKDLKKTMSKFTKTQAKLQEKADKINNEKNALNGTIEGIQSDISYKKSAVNEVVLESNFLKNNVIQLVKGMKKRAFSK